MPSSSDAPPVPAARRSSWGGLYARHFSSGIAGLLLLAATFLTYAPVWRAGFVWNDLDYVTHADLRSLHGLWRIWFEVGSTEQHYPLLHSFFWLEHRLWADAPLGYHLTNVFLHATAALLFALCLRRLLAITPAVSSATPKIENPKSEIENSLPWLAAFLFALHPVCVESVAWISEQKNTLSLCLYLAAALAYLRFDDLRRPDVAQASPPASVSWLSAWGELYARQLRAYRLATLLFILALLAKSLTATLPPGLLVVLWWRRGRMELRRDVFPLLPWFFLGALFGVFSAWVEHSVLGTVGHDFDLTWAQRLLVAGRAIFFYLGKLLWPADLVFIYPRWAPNPADPAQWLFPLGVLLLLAALVFIARRFRVRGPLAALLFFAGSLFPVMGFFNLYGYRYAFVADHWQYLPSLGVHVAFAFALVRLSSRLATSFRFSTTSVRIVRLAPVALCALLATLSWRETLPYRDLETFYRTIIARNPTCRLAYNNLGSLLLKNLDLRSIASRYQLTRSPLTSRWQLTPLVPPDASAPSQPLPPPARRLAEAMQLYQRALAVDPENPEALSNIGYFLTQLGQLEPGIAFLEHALRVRPEFTEALLDVGNAYVAAGRLSDGIRALRLALQLNPRFEVAGDSLGNALLRAGRLDEAIAQYTATLRLYPDYLDARVNLGSALVRVDRLDEAVLHFELALRQNPDSAEAHNNLGYALLRLARFDDAIAHFERALALWPDYTTARANLELARRSR